MCAFDAREDTSSMFLAVLLAKQNIEAAVMAMLGPEPTPLSFEVIAVSVVGISQREGDRKIRLDFAFESDLPDGCDGAKHSLWFFLAPRAFKRHRAYAACTNPRPDELPP